MLLTQARAAEMLGVCRQTLRSAVNSGKVKVVVLNKRRLIPLSEVERLARAGKQRPA